MKQILFALLLLPFYCHAQLEFGVDGGIVPAPKGQFGVTGTPKTGYVTGVGISYKVHRVRLGLGYSSEKIPYNGDYYSSFSRLSDIYFFADREAVFDRWYLDLGASAGCAFLKFVSYYNGLQSETAENFAVGIHASISYRIYKGLCVGIQSGMTDLVDPDGSSLIFLPFTLGAHYKLQLPKHKATMAK